MHILPEFVCCEMLWGVYDALNVKSPAIVSGADGIGETSG